MTRAEYELILTIARRAFAKAYNGRERLIDAVIDLTKAHEQCPLDLEAMVDASRAGTIDFWHDVCGIRRHMNRDTGTLEDCFVPRFAMPKGSKS